MTFWIRRWYHVRTAKRTGSEPHNYDEWHLIIEGWPLKRAVPSFIKNIKWNWQRTMTVWEKGCVTLLLVFLALSIVLILAVNI